MSERGDEEIVSESYRRRNRLLGRMLLPFDILSGIEIVFYLAAAIGVVTLVIVNI